MICPSCSKELTTQFRREANVFGGVTSYFCAPCKEEALVWEDMKVGCFSLEKGRYRLYCDSASNTCKIQQIYMDIESDTSIMYRWYTVLEINAIPQGITDENFEEKVKMMLVFS